ncbi:hypothetical protein ATCC90586_004348 [Pythium insidiosum]|nr:hypothetical protein ATCC90586_004348 [Pythium insidiosum]
MRPQSSASSCSLLGIALVVDDINKGCNLAFRYPAPADNASTFHKLSAPLIAKLFRPKNALCNQSFELVIDDLRFVSHPILVPRRSATGAIVSAGTAAASGASGAHGHSTSASPTGATLSGATTGQPAAAPATAAAVADAANTAAPAAAATSASSSAGGTPSENETTMFNVIFALDERPHNSRSNASGPVVDDDSDRAKRSAFDAQRHKRQLAAFRAIAAQLANGLLHEELRAGFVTRQVHELLHIRDELAQQERLLASSSGAGSGSGSATSSSAAGANSAASSGTGSKDSGAGGSGGEGRLTAIAVDPQTIIDVSLGKNMLANDLKSVFHGLDESGTAHVVLNRWVKLSLTLADALPLEHGNQLRPYQTLLLLDDEDKILQALPTDHSHQLRVLITAANPLKSFQDLALETSLPIHQLFRLAAHLVYWGYGRIMDTITMHNIYQVAPTCSFASHSPQALEFRRRFAPRELSEVLASFSGSRRIGEYVKNLSTAKKVEYIHMLIWLMQNNMVIQLHRYVYFMIPSDQDAPLSGGSAGSRRRRVTGGGDDDEGDSDSDRDVCEELTNPQDSTAARVPLSRVGLTPQERAYLDKIATTNPVFTLFKRLCVYFHGQYHLEEIMWRENVSRSELRTVLSTYQDITVCCLHE